MLKIITKIKKDDYSPFLNKPFLIPDAINLDLIKSGLSFITTFFTFLAKKIEQFSVFTLTLKIPQGIRDGEKIRLIGQGKPGRDGGKSGDLLIKVKVKDDNKFKLKGCDLYTDLLLTPWEAALGTRAIVQSIDDETKVYIPQGIQSGEKIRIPNKGYQSSKTTRGDLVAEIKIVVPKQLTQQEEKIFKKLNEISNFNPRK